MRDLTLNEVEQVNGGNIIGDLMTYASFGALGTTAGFGISKAVGDVTLNALIAPCWVGQTAIFTTAIPPVAFVGAGLIAGFAVASYVLSY